MSDARSPRRSVAPHFVFLERLGHNDFEVAAVDLVDRTQPRRFLLLDHPGDLVHRKLIEMIWQPLCQQLEQYHAQRINIRAAVEPARVGRKLFGAHVVECAQQLTGPGLARSRQNVGRRDVGNAEIEDFGLARFLDQDVARLQVAMNDGLIVSVLHRVAHLGQKLEARPSVEASTAGILIQGHPADHFHGDEWPAVVTHARFIDLGDTEMLEPGQDLCFILEPLDELE